MRYSSVAESPPKRAVEPEHGGCEVALCFEHKFCLLSGGSYRPCKQLN